MPLFTVSRPTVALSTSTDLMTIVPAATKPLRIYIADIKGMGNSSVPNEVLMCRSSGGTSPTNSGGTAATVGKLNPNSASASFSVYTGWSGQPTLGEVMWRYGVNANGGQDKQIAFPGAEFSVPVGSQVSFRGTGAAASNVVINVLVEEIDG